METSKLATSMQLQQCSSMVEVGFVFVCGAVCKSAVVQPSVVVNSLYGLMIANHEL